MSWGFIRNSIIKKTPGKEEWCVESESGKNMGCSDSYGAAAKRLGEVEWFKKHKKKGSADCPIGVDHIHEDLSEFKEIDEHLTDAKKVVKNMVNEDKDALKKAADLGSHGDSNSNTDLYQETGTGYVADTDLTDRDKQTHPHNQKDVNGVDPGFASQREHNETMLTKEVRKHEDRKDMVTFDFQPQLGRITEDTAGEFHDNTNKVDGPKEGEVLGLQPSYSAAELYVAITPRQSAWGFERESLFDQFIGNVGEILASCKQHGASRAAAREAAIKVHSTLFAKQEWMSPILERFLDRAYGTTAKVQSSLATLEGCISDYVVTAHKNGTPKEKTLQASMNEFSSWIENYPETQTLIENRIDATYGVSPEVIAPFLGKNAANDYAAQLAKEFKQFPLPYAEFRRWCSARQVTVPTLYALERIAVELNYVTMPETLVIFSEKEMFVSDPNTGAAPKVVVQDKNPDPNQQVKKQILPDGTEVDLAQKAP